MYKSPEMGSNKEFVDKSRILNVMSAHCGGGLNKVLEISSLFIDGGIVIRDSDAALIGFADIRESLIVIPAK
jgi:hypothetical protein